MLSLQARVRIAALQVQKQLAEQAREEAEATVAELEAQLEEIGAEIADHMEVSVLGYFRALLKRDVSCPCLIAAINEQEDLVETIGAESADHMQVCCARL